MKEAYAVRRTVPPSVEIEAQIDQLLAVGVGENPRGSLSELARLGARLIIQRAVEDEFDAWLGRTRYERRPQAPPGLRNGFRPRRVQTAEGELSVEIPQVREAAETFASKLFPRTLDIWDLAARPAGELPFDRLELLRRAADAALLTGEEERAITLAGELLVRIDEHDAPIEAALAYERLGRYLWSAGRDTDALPAYRRAVELMPDAPPSKARALALAAEGQVLMLCNRTTESIARCEEALAISRRSAPKPSRRTCSTPPAGISAGPARATRPSLRQGRHSRSPAAWVSLRR